MISCLTVTCNRPNYQDLLLWNFNKQTCESKELLIIDGSDCNRSEISGSKRIRYIHLKNESSIPLKRNIALNKARGKYVTWFDDDDWQHPGKCEILYNYLEQGYDIVGAASSLFYNVHTNQYRIYQGNGKPIFNSMGVRTYLAQEVLFDESRAKGTDNAWRLALLRKKNIKIKIIEEPMLFFWLCHDSNITNNVRRRRFYRNAKGDERLAKILGDDKDSFYKHLNIIQNHRPCLTA